MRILSFKLLAKQLSNKGNSNPAITVKVRKGSGKEVTHVAENDKPSKTLKAGKRTYFFDVKETKDGKPYLTITESWFKGEDDQEATRNTLMVFPENAKDFAFAATEMLARITQE